MKTINKTQQGFTLVELIIVIVILGILAVTAAPRFLNLAGDARGATLDAVEASVISINNLVTAKARLQEVSLTANGVTVTDDGLVITLDQGQPRTTAADVTTWQALLDSTDFTTVSNTDIGDDGKFTATAGDKRNAIIILPATGGYTAPAAVADTGCYVYVINYVDTVPTVPVPHRELGIVTDGCS